MLLSTKSPLTTRGSTIPPYQCSIPPLSFGALALETIIPRRFDVRLCIRPPRSRREQTRPRRTRARARAISRPCPPCRGHVDCQTSHSRC
ncbi:hypothetical protein SERLA73DRAFT_192106 [Serpula lacrymans var. lacrymans S7.3]|uniref:Uncharacterized protein n=1 Tax=Serpula lacrymans var. lacrymans (strain S7.3) TaxID=936435 RepID=F8QJ07_SERL3|nr:hypothetical protein SERLA73DRAFT_192106 [Serpula lacrymans var. lacrymans S7.3]